MLNRMNFVDLFERLTLLNKFSVDQEVPVKTLKVQKYPQINLIEVADVVEEDIHQGWKGKKLAFSTETNIWRKRK